MLLREAEALIPSQSSFRMVNPWFSFHIRCKAGLPKRLTETKQTSKPGIYLALSFSNDQTWMGCISCLQLFWQGMEFFPGFQTWLFVRDCSCMWHRLLGLSARLSLTSLTLNSALLMRPTLMLYDSSPFVCHAPKRIWETGRAVWAGK